MLTVDGKSDLYVLNGGTDTGDDSADTISDAIAQKKLYIEPTLSPADAKISGSLRTALYAYLSREPFTHQYCEGLEDDHQDYDHSATAARANYNPYIRRDNYPFRVGEFVYIDLLLNGDDLVAQQVSSDAVIKFLGDSGVPQSELPVNAPSSDDHRIFLVNGWVHFSFLRPLARLPEIYRVNPAESASAERLDLLFRITERSGNDLGLKYSMPGCNATSYGFRHRKAQAIPGEGQADGAAPLAGYAESM